MLDLPSGDLFRRETVAQFFKDRESWYDAQIRRVNELQELEKRRPELVDDATVVTAELLRDQAEFHHKESSEGNLVILTVPLNGDFRTLGLTPAQFPAHSPNRFPGEAWSGREFTSDDDRARVVFGRVFDGPEVSEVREWGRTTVDNVERVLGVLRPEVEAGSTALAAFVLDALRKRRQVLTASAGLGDLGTGI